MYFDRLELRNFGPYYGRQEMDLAVADGKPLVVVHGENMRGKTSLINSFRWCLYGEAFDRQGKLMRSEDLFNSVARAEGADEAGVTLEFTHEGKAYQVTRSLRAEGKGPLSERFLIKHNGEVSSKAVADQMVAEIMDERIARFFLFDGEMLGDYERLLQAGDAESDLVRESIESILGLPALRSTQDDLSELARMAYDRQSKAAKANKEANQARIQHADAVERLKSAQTSLRRAKAKSAELHERQKALVVELEELAASKLIMQKIDRRNLDITNAEQGLTAARQQLQEVLRLSWWTPVSAQIEGRLVEVRERLGTAATREKQVTALGETARSLRETLDHAVCDTCGQDLPADRTDPMKGRLKDVLAEIETLSIPQTPSVGELLNEQDRLRVFARPAEAPRIRDLEIRIRGLLRDRRDAARELEELQHQLRASDAETVRRKQSEYDNILQDQGRAAAEITKQAQIVDELQAQIKKLQTKAAQGAGDEESAVEHAVLQTVANLYEEAVARFRDELRSEVNDEASDIFMALTTEKGYRGLQINDQYGLRILDHEGKELAVRSAGAEHIVALSLIGALNRCAIRRGTVVMDTPFGRLDLGHRANILNWIPTLAEHVVLLVQSGEVRENDDLLNEVQHLIGREYRIVRDGMPTKSKVVPV